MKQQSRNGRVCAHVKRGICQKCLNPLKPARAKRLAPGTVSVFGSALRLAVLLRRVQGVTTSVHYDHSSFL